MVAGDARARARAVAVRQPRHRRAHAPPAAVRARGHGARRQGQLLGIFSEPSLERDLQARRRDVQGDAGRRARVCGRCQPDPHAWRGTRPVLLHPARSTFMYQPNVRLPAPLAPTTAQVRRENLRATLHRHRSKT